MHINSIFNFQLINLTLLIIFGLSTLKINAESFSSIGAMYKLMDLSLDITKNIDDHLINNDQHNVNTIK